MSKIVIWITLVLTAGGAIFYATTRCSIGCQHKMFQSNIKTYKLDGWFGRTKVNGILRSNLQ